MKPRLLHSATMSSIELVILVSVAVLASVMAKMLAGYHLLVENLRDMRECNSGGRFFEAVLNTSIIYRV